jgi:hypothetical protein
MCVLSSFPLQWPAIPGLETFKGPKAHSANWPENFDIKGKRVGLIGVGSTATQVVPSIQPDVKHMTAFARSKTWVCFGVAVSCYCWIFSNLILRSRRPLVPNSPAPMAQTSISAKSRRPDSVKIPTSTTSQQLCLTFHALLLTSVIDSARTSKMNSTVAFG